MYKHLRHALPLLLLLALTTARAQNSSASGNDAKERKINKEIDELIDAKAKIMHEIQDVPDERFVEILMRRYISCQKLEDIAKEMGYVHGWIRQLHGQALIAFEHVHPEISEY